MKSFLLLPFVSVTFTSHSLVPNRGGWNSRGVGIVEGLEKPQNLNFGGLDNDQKFYRIGNGFLSQIYSKKTLSGPLSETTLNHTTHEINVLFMIFFTCWPKCVRKNIALGEILLTKITRQGAEIRIPWVE